MKKTELSPFQNYLIMRLKRGVFNGKKLFSEIKEQGFEGSYTTLYRYLRNDLGSFWTKYRQNSHNLFKHSKSSPSSGQYKRAVRIETNPGEQAQVDWGYFKEVVINNRVEKLYCFIFILSYSRAIYIEFTTSQQLPSFELCHIHAFRTLGIPQNIVYDNTKTVVISREKLPDGSKRVHYNPAFLDFANYYGYNIVASPPYWPRYKGKVESGVKFIRNNFMQGIRLPKELTSLDQLNKEAVLWVKNIANNRIHATTKERPFERWLKEKTYLGFPDALPDYQTSPFLIRFSTKDQLVQYKQNFYSVPKEFAWKKLFVREINDNGNKLVNIYYQDNLIAQHSLSSERGKLIENPAHFQSDISSLQTKLQTKTQQWKKYPAIKVRSLHYYETIITRR